MQAGKLLVKDVIADIAFQQMLTRASEFDVIATMNLNGDYLSDAVAAEVGGIGIAPGTLFSTAGRYGNCIRLNAAFWSERVEQALETLGGLAEAMM